MEEEYNLMQEDLSNVADSIRSTYKDPLVQAYNSNSGSDKLNSMINEIASSKKGLQEYSDVKFTDAYERLNSGDYVAKYPNISVTDLNQEERLAQQQATSNKWSNGLTKFLGKVGTGVLGGTIGTVAGIGNLVNDFSLEATYDNGFNRWLDDLNTRMDYKLPNYYSQAEKDKSLFSQMGTANFWANDVLGGAAFTVSAIGSEAIWGAVTGGTSLATSFARIGARAAGLYSKGSKGLRAIKEAKNFATLKGVFAKTGKVTDNVAETTAMFGKAGQLVNTARFTYTSAGFEAGFEARHFMNEQIDKFEQDFEELNGRAPTMEDREKFRKDLTEASNNLFGFNLALVGSSNMAIFGKLYDIKSPFALPKKYMNSKLFGIGNKTKITKEGKKQIEKITANKLQKFVRSSYSLGKAGFMEGFVEEGGQGMGGSTAGSWVSSGYDAESYKAQLDLGEAMSEGFAEAYGTKEGQKEVLIGTLIGMITGTGVNLAQGKSPFSDMNELQKKANQEYAYRKEYSADKTIAAMQKGSRVAKAVEDLETAEEIGDTVGAETARQNLMMAHIVEAEKFDFSEEAKQDFFEGINRMKDEEIQSQFGLDSQEDAQEFKQKILSDYSNFSERYKKYREFTEYFLTDVAKKEGLSAANTEVLKEAIAVELTMGENMNEHASNLLQSIKEELTQGMYNTKAESISRGLTVEDILSSASKETKQKFNETRKELKGAKNRLEQLENKRREQAKTKPAEDLNKTVAEIDELQEKVRVLEAENEAQLSAMVLENPFRKDDQEFITGKDLENIEKDLKYVAELLEVYKSKNPQKYAKLSLLLRDYGTVKKGFQRYADLNEQISNPELGLRGKRNLIKELMLDKEPNQITLDLLKTTQETAEEITKRRATYTGETEVENLSELTEEELKEFNENGTIPQSAITKIATKRDNAQPLSDKESEIYNKFKSEIDQEEVKLRKTSMETPKNTEEPTPEKTPIQKIIDDNEYLVHYIGTEEVTKEEYEQYKKDKKEFEAQPELGRKKKRANNRNVLNNVVDKIAKKLKKGDDLTEIEQEIYNEEFYKGRIDLAVKNMPKKGKPLMPTPEELEEYKELLAAVKKDRKLPLNKVIRVAANYFAKRGTKVSLTPTQLQRFKDLNQKVQDFQLYKHYTNEEGISLAELIEQQVSLEQEPSSEEQLKKEVTEEDQIDLLNNDQGQETKDGRREGIIQTYEGTKVRKAKEGYLFSHIKLATFLSRMAGLSSIKIQEPTSYKKDGTPNYSKPKKVDLKDIDKYEGVPDIKILLKAGDKTVELKNRSRARIQVSSSELDTFLELTGFKVYKNALVKNNKYSDVYETNEEGEDVQKDADFGIQDESGQVKEYNAQQAYDMEEGDTIQFYLNKEDSWNKNLRKQRLEGKISKEKLLSMVKVYVAGRGKIMLGDLKSAEGMKDPGKNFMALRQAAVDSLMASKDSNSPTLVELPFITTMKSTFLGTPTVKAKDGKPIEIALTDEMLEEIEDYGTYKDGKFNLKNNTKKVRDDFVSKLKNAPVIVVKKGKYLIAYPVSLKRNEQGKSEEFAKIMGSRGNMTKKATQINNLLAERGTKPNLYHNSAEDQNMFTEEGEPTEALLKAEQILNEEKKYTDPKTWTEGNHDKALLKDEIKTSIDLTGKKFISPKPIIDFKNKNNGGTFEINKTQNQGTPKTASAGQFNDDTMKNAKEEGNKKCND